MGVDVMAIVAAGGANGKQLKEMLTRSGVQFKCFDIEDETCQNLGVTEKATGKMYHLVFPGQSLKQSEWQDCLAYVTSLEPRPEYLVLSGSLPQGVPDDFYEKIAHDAGKKGIKIILDTSGRALAAPLNAGVYLAKLNRSEFADSGYLGSLDDYHAMLCAMADMVERGMAEALIVTLDAHGALLASRDGTRLHICPPPTKIVSHVGAGDSFVSLLVYQLHRGKSLTDAFYYGVAAAAAKVQTPGNSLNNLTLVEAIYQQMISKRDH